MKNKKVLLVTSAANVEHVGTKFCSFKQRRQQVLDNVESLMFRITKLIGEKDICLVIADRTYNWESDADLLELKHLYKGCKLIIPTLDQSESADLTLDKGKLEAKLILDTMNLLNYDNDTLVIKISGRYQIENITALLPKFQPGKLVLAPYSIVLSRCNSVVFWGTKCAVIKFCVEALDGVSENENVYLEHIIKRQHKFLQLLKLKICGFLPVPIYRPVELGSTACVETNFKRYIKYILYRYL